MYNEADDFSHHAHEIDLMFKLISPPVDFNDKIILNVGAGEGMHLSFLQNLNPKSLA